MIRLPTAAALVLALAPTSNAHAQIVAYVDGTRQDIPAGTARIVTIRDGRQMVSDRPWHGETVPGAATITTTETTDEDDRGRIVARTTVTRIEPQQVAYAAPMQITIMQQTPAASYAPVQQPAAEIDEGASNDIVSHGMPHVIRLHRDSWNGHFVAPITINGVKVRAIIDTGAAYTILSADDARATGADRQVIRQETAVGIGGYTSVGVAKLSSIEIAGQELGRIVARIGQPGIPYTLLGQTEIAKLGRVNIENGTMTITPKGMGDQLAMR